MKKVIVAAVLLILCLSGILFYQVGRQQGFWTQERSNEKKTEETKESQKEVENVTEDGEKPKLTLLGAEHMSLEAGEAYYEVGYRATDDCDGDLGNKVRVEGKVETDKPGTYTLRYSVEDKAGNQASVKRIVEVADTTRPELSLSGGEVIYQKVGESYQEPGYVAHDSLDGDITAQVEVLGSVDVTQAGEYVLTYAVTDKAGNRGEITRTVRVYQPAQTNVEDPGDKVVYLTFDDGPGPYTQELLDVLDRYQVKVTFFVTNTMSDYRALIAEEAKRGHTVAIHSATHRYVQIYQSEEAYFADLEAMNDIIFEQTGVRATIIRFPGGSSNTVSRKYCEGIMSRLAEAVVAKGYLYCDWNVASGDAGETKSTEQVVQNVIAGIQSHKVSVVLQHDIKDFSVRAVEEILQWGLANGYTFLPLTPASPMSKHGINN